MGGDVCKTREQFIDERDVSRKSGDGCRTRQTACSQKRKRKYQRPTIHRSHPFIGPIRSNRN
jgi:hypothetical protein